MGTWDDDGGLDEKVLRVGLLCLGAWGRVDANLINQPGQ